MKIEILRKGCAKYAMMEENTREALKGLQINARVEKVTDNDKMAEFGVITTPALAVDGVVKYSGHVPTVGDVKKLPQGSTNGRS